MPEKVFFFHEPFFRELAEKSNHGEPENEYDSSVHLIKKIIWLNGGSETYGYTTDQIIDSVDEEEYSKKLSDDVVDGGSTELGIRKVSRGGTKATNLVKQARRFYSFNEDVEEIVIVTAEGEKEEVENIDDLEFDVKTPQEALDYATETDLPINR